VFDVVIAGGGVVGSSVAYHLARESPGLSVAVVERDSSYAHASAPLSAGGIRQQFSMKENIEMSLYGVQFLKDVDTALRVDDNEVPSVQLHEGGYLFMASTEEGEAILRRNHGVQLAAGCDWIRLLNPIELMAKFPWINADGIRLAALGEKNEGWFDPWALLGAMRSKATSLGVTYIQGEVNGVQLGDQKQIEAVQVLPKGGGGGLTLRTNTMVNAGGAFAARLVEMCGEVAALPVKARKRCIFVVHCPEALDPLPPLTVDPSGVYFRPEGVGTEGGSSGRFICGVSPPAEDDPDCDTYSQLDVTERDFELFENTIWPALYNRCEAFGSLKRTAAWSGFYGWCDYHLIYKLIFILMILFILFDTNNN